MLPSPLQISLGSFRIFIGSFKDSGSFSVPTLRTPARFEEKPSVSAPAKQHGNQRD
jgi:hypothetical protein